MPKCVDGRMLIAVVVVISTMSIWGCRPTLEWMMDDTEPVSFEQEVASEVQAPPPSASEVVALPQAPANPPPVQVNTYTVQRGDTLWSIATRTYGDGKRWRHIVSANQGLDPTRLRVGQKIILP